MWRPGGSRKPAWGQVHDTTVRKERQTTMTGSAPVRPRATLEDPAVRLRAIAAGLIGAGLATDLHETRVGLDMRATLHQSGRRAAEVLLDEEGYVELRWWTDLSAPPADVTAAITRVLAAITTVPAVLAPSGGTS